MALLGAEERWGLVRQKKSEYKRHVLVSVRRRGDAIWLHRHIFLLEERRGIRACATDVHWWKG